MAILYLTRTNDIVDGQYRPIASNLTVQGAARWLAREDADLPAYVEAHFRLEPTAPVSLDDQMAAKVRRLRAIAKGCGRSVVRVDRRHGMTQMYYALLAR